MTRPLAVLDSSALIFLITDKADDSPEEQEAERRRSLVKERIQAMQKTYRWAIPSAAVAELGRDGPAAAAVQRLLQGFSRFRVLALDYRAACIAATIAAKALKGRPRGAERGAVKYDALICATAIRYGAESIVTENPRDFAQYLAQVGSQIKLEIPSNPPSTGQLHLLHQSKKPRPQGP
jgi:predicted nucleic acid-binding protein